MGTGLHSKMNIYRFLHSFEDFYRKLGVTLVAHPRGARTPPAGRSLIRDRDKQPPTSSSASSTPTGTPSQVLLLNLYSVIDNQLIMVSIMLIIPHRPS